MGIIDSTDFTLTCPNCGEAESGRAVQYGSSWSHGGWSNPPDFKKFVVQWQEDKSYGPLVRAATCQKCGAAASVGTM